MIGGLLDKSLLYPTIVLVLSYKCPRILHLFLNLLDLRAVVAIIDNWSILIKALIISLLFVFEFEKNV